MLHKTSANYVYRKLPFRSLSSRNAATNPESFKRHKDARCNWTESNLQENPEMQNVIWADKKTSWLPYLFEFYMRTIKKAAPEVVEELQSALTLLATWYDVLILLTPTLWLLKQHETLARRLLLICFVFFSFFVQEAAEILPTIISK